MSRIPEWLRQEHARMQMAFGEGGMTAQRLREEVAHMPPRGFRDERWVGLMLKAAAHIDELEEALRRAKGGAA